MRFRRWSITVLGVIGVVASAVLMQDQLWSGERSSDEPTLLRRTINYFSRSGKSGNFTSRQLVSKQPNAESQATESTQRTATLRALPSIPTASRYTRTPETRRSTATQPGSSEARPTTVKNYYNQLFTEGQGASKLQDSRPRGITPSQQLQSARARAQASTLDPTPAEAQQSTATGTNPIPDANLVQAATPVSNALLPENGRTPGHTDPFQVIHADHQRAADAATERTVQPVGADQVPPFPWALSPTGPAATAASGPPTRAPAGEPVTSAASPEALAVSSGSPESNETQLLALEPQFPQSRNYGSEAPVIKLEWVKPTELTIGQTCRLQLLVSNTGQAAAENVVVVAYFPQTVRLTEAKPMPVESQDHLAWQFASLTPGEEQTIEISMISSSRGDLDVTALARFSESSSVSFTVEEPLLKLAMKGPKEVLVGDPASQIVTISNPGTGAAHGVLLEVEVPEGLEHPRGSHLMMELGSLSPGESRTVRLSLAAVGGGQKSLELKARADGGLSQSVAAAIHVIAPSLKLGIEGPRLRYVGRHARYRIAVANDGDAATNNVRVTHRVPDGFDFVNADKGGTFDPATRAVHWFIGRLEANESAQLAVELDASQLGDFVHTIAATCEQGANSETQLATKVDGTASLVLDVVDYDDPVEVGGDTTYEVRVTNDGTKAAQNVGLACELPAGLELLAVKGATQHKAESNAVVFQTLPQLAPNKTALFRLQIRGKTPGNHRIRARLSSDSIQEPLVVDELTKFYAE